MLGAKTQLQDVKKTCSYINNKEAKTYKQVDQLLPPSQIPAGDCLSWKAKVACHWNIKTELITKNHRENYFPFSATFYIPS